MVRDLEGPFVFPLVSVVDKVISNNFYLQLLEVQLLPSCLLIFSDQPLLVTSCKIAPYLLKNLSLVVGKFSWYSLRKSLDTRSKNFPLLFAKVTH